VTHEQLELGGMGGSLLAVKRRFAEVTSLLLTVEIDLCASLASICCTEGPVVALSFPRRKAVLPRASSPYYAPFGDRTRHLRLLRAIYQ
jgi:hypothetical protein